MVFSIKRHARDRFLYVEGINDKEGGAGGRKNIWGGNYDLYVSAARIKISRFLLNREKGANCGAAKCTKK